MKRLICLIVLSGLIFGYSSPMVAKASFTPPPRATFTSPSFGSTTSADKTNITFNLNLAGHPGLINKNLYVFPVFCKYSFFSEYNLCDFDYTSWVTASFTDPNASQQYIFENVAMQYLGNNYVSCYVYDPSTNNGDFCRYGENFDYVWVKYTGALLPVYRFWSDTKKHHFFTQSSTERDSVISNYDDSVWRYEKIAYYTSRTEACRGTGVHRFWSNTKQGHFYTASEPEKNHIISNYPQNVWKYEGVSFCADVVKQNSSQVPVYRFWSHTYQAHFYTIDEVEKNNLIATNKNWWYEGIAYYGNTD